MIQIYTFSSHDNHFDVSRPKAVEDGFVIIAQLQSEQSKKD